jgi:hypothetical protein
MNDGVSVDRYEHFCGGYFPVIVMSGTITGMFVLTSIEIGMMLKQ